MWVLAPTWIAVNAAIGVWFSQSIFQFAQANPRFPDQALMQGFAPVQISAAAVVIGVIFGAGLLYWGNRFKSTRRTTIILYGILGGGALVAAGIVVNHSAGLPLVLPLAAGIVAAAGTATVTETAETVAAAGIAAATATTGTGAAGIVTAAAGKADARAGVARTGAATGATMTTSVAAGTATAGAATSTVSVVTTGGGATAGSGTTPASG